MQDISRTRTRKKGSKRRSSAAPPDTIALRGVRVHNLKNISVDLPRNKLIVVTGVSGSGKSSLAFDTIYAEGQRRYVESLSAYARQFLERMEKPDVDAIHGIGPAMAIEQKTNTRNPRSTVATSTEIYDYLRLLFARTGVTICRKCGNRVTRDSVHTVLTFLDGLKRNDRDELRILIAFPLPDHPDHTLEDSIAFVRKQGFFRLLHNGNVVETEDGPLPAGISKESTFVLLDRLTYRPVGDQSRLTDSIESAFTSGGGTAIVVVPDASITQRFNRRFECATCGIPYEEPEPRMFSFNSPVGACPECQGFGRAMGLDMDLVVPDKTRALRHGAVQPWTTPKFAEQQRKMLSAAKQADIRTDVPYADLSAEERQWLMEGDRGFEGIRKFFARIERKSYKIFYRVFLSRYRGYTLCSLCEGSRLKQEALNVRVGGRRIPDIVSMTVHDAGGWVSGLTLPPEETRIAQRILDELRKRLKYLDDVGIGYLSLDRLSSTLSGGESQRINLATSLGSSLVGALYVLDEPSIGLHPRDGEKLIRILKALRDAGNTVLVVEHDREIMNASDFIVDLGPGAGEQGGEVMFAGPSREISSSVLSLTGRYLTGASGIDVPAKRRSGNGKSIVIRNAYEHNLKNIDVIFPLGMMVCVTGVSGSGKSSLVYDVLLQGLRRAKGDFSGKDPRCSSIDGAEHIDAIESVDQSPIGRTPRSNPVTYVQVFDQIRTLYSNTQAARIHGFKPGHFSFNVPGGRCEACEGDGVIKVEMQFMADLYLTCDACKGKRYQQEVLDIRWNGMNIDEVLRMTVNEAVRFFGTRAEGARIARKLKVLQDVGLGYVRLGQPATSLSGGEAQRVKLAAHLGGSVNQESTLFLFDEPTTGLHFDDIAKLISCFQALLAAGHSVVIIEHNLDVIKCADYVIDLGPEAGAFGGQVVGAGTPEEIAEIEGSATGRYLMDLVRPLER